MAVMLNVRMVLMLVVVPTGFVMVICHGATRTDGNEENSKDGGY